MSLAGVIVLLFVLVVGGAYAVSAYRRRVEQEGVSGDVAEEQRRYLAANWSAVEQAAQGSGMGSEQIAEVRRKLLGV